VYVSDVQRSRVLSSAVAVIAEGGYGRMSVARITGRARVSRRTFYDLFKDREDCFLAAFEQAVAQASEVVRTAYAGETRWVDGVRAGLTALLEFLEGEPAVCSLLVVDALAAGPRVLEQRARVLDAVKGVVDRGRLQSGQRREVPPLTADGVVGAVFSVVHARVLERRGAPRLLDLRNPLMAMIVLPYLGQAAAAKELERPVARAKRTARPRGELPMPGDPLEGLSMRFTYRTLRTLEVIGERPGASNREIADVAGVSDQGQMSKLLARLEGLGLIKNRSEAQPSGEPNAWRLTTRGQQVRQSIVVQHNQGAQDNRGDLPSNSTRGMDR
jgi:AcrR family transcriptional regulator/DNA-binding MarR family transcriptional regulator